jgi:hypothetical protein
MKPAAPREVRLRPKYAGRYPSLPAGEWLTSSQLAASLVARAQRARAAQQRQRTFDPRHFEFRPATI